jgi:hypothetical protein
VGNSSPKGHSHVCQPCHALSTDPSEDLHCAFLLLATIFVGSQLRGLGAAGLCRRTLSPWLRHQVMGVNDLISQMRFIYMYKYISTVLKVFSSSTAIALILS